MGTFEQLGAAPPDPLGVAGELVLEAVAVVAGALAKAAAAAASGLLDLAVEGSDAVLLDSRHYALPGGPSGCVGNGVLTHSPRQSPY